MQRAEKRFAVLLRRVKGSRIPEGRIARIEALRKINEGAAGKRTGTALFAALSLAAFLMVTAYQTSECYLEIPFDAAKIFRKPEECDFCEGLTGVDRLKNVTPARFAEAYAAPGRPVVVADGTRGWAAVDAFSFAFFKRLYRGYSKLHCQFFPYKTEFKSLKEALNMSEARARLEEGQRSWYIGWSNCNDEAGKVLSKYYSRPYFLPETSENLALSWIFMGGPGHGAHMHVDDVHYPSWQAQIKGRKKWRLAPPPECLYRCGELEVVVEPGEIIVVDTNRWYHQTFVLSGGVSITIGSEFD